MKDALELAAAIVGVQEEKVSRKVEKHVGHHQVRVETVRFIVQLYNNPVIDSYLNENRRYLLQK